MNCLTPEQIEKLARGEIEGDEAAKLQTHIEQCDTCRAKLDECLANEQHLHELKQDLGSTVPVSEPAGPDGADAQAKIGQHIGSYRVVEVLGQGGMGVVYLAEQDHPRRTVALKVIRPGLTRPELLRRFEHEAEILGRLQHPGIAQIYEAGTADAGSGPQQFFAMERVEGLPLSEYAAAHKLGIRARLELFSKVCAAVEHAHQKGVIHRDLKPGNILVTKEGQPKVLDFGVARATDADIQTTTLQTDIGQLLGTIPYMSPEQAAGDPDELDTRSDVYALGVVLYELLAGRLPHDLARKMIHEAVRIIREDDPTPLSSVNRVLRGDVETIVAKALEKDKTRRYQSASDLASDIGRYLADEPIVARPTSAAYQFRKFAKRNKTLVGGVSAVFVVLVAGIIGTSWGLIEAREQRAVAEENERRALASEEKERAARTVADQRYEEIIRLADLKRLADASVAADSLWPAHPEKTEAMETWLTTKAAPLRDNLPKHEATLNALRDQALEYDPEQQKHDRETHPKAAELAEQKQRLTELQKELDDARAEESEDAEAKAKKIEELEKTVADTEQSISELQEGVKERRTWEFPDDQTQWQHDTLAGLVEDLKAFVDPDPKKGTLASVQERLEFAESIKERSITGSQAAAKWAEAIADIAQLEVYGGLQIKPQLDLLPLRRDPRSGLWEFWHIQTGSKPEKSLDDAGVNPWILTEDTGLVFVLIPNGTFWMGAQKKDSEGRNYDPEADDTDESPVHEVTLAAFFISKYEMTQGQWQRFTGMNPSQFDPSWGWKGNQNTPWNPVEQVSWTECQKVLERLGLVLPTEAQWEYAARARTNTVWWTGDNKESIGVEGAGNLADGWTKSKGGPSDWPYEEWLEDGWLAHAPVGSFLANGFGLHDVIGNVWEWCRDEYGGYDSEVRTGDGLRKVGRGRGRVLRGGAFRLGATYARSASRVSPTSHYRSSNVGVRPARSITE